MKVAVIGAGSIGRRHIKGLAGLREQSGIKEIRVFDPNAERCRATTELGQGIAPAPSMEAAVKGADAVFVCAPTSLHTSVFSQLLSLGSFHVFMEKPLASAASGWEELLGRHRKSGKVFAVGYMLRRHPVLRRVKALLEQEVLGRVLHARAESGFYLPYWHPHEDYRDFYMSSRTGGGGALLDTSHEIDYLTWLFGPIAEVQGTVETVSALEITSDDLVLGSFKFKSGVRGQVHLDLLQFDEARHCKVIGTEGVLRGDLVAGEVALWKKDAKAWSVEKLTVDWNEIYGSEYGDFLANCRGTKAETVEGASALHVLEAVEAMRRSHSSGGIVRLPLWDL